MSQQRGWTKCDTHVVQPNERPQTEDAAQPRSEKMAENEVLEAYELEENLGDAEKPPELPNGTYLAEIQDVQDATSAAGNPYWAVRFRVPPSECPPEIAEAFEDGVVLTYSRLMKPKKGDARARYNLKQFYLALGLNPHVTTVDPTAWMGQPARIVVKQQPYQNEMRAGIVSIEAGEDRPTPKARTTGSKGRR